MSIEKTEFRGTTSDMRGGVPVFKGSEQYGGLVVPAGLSIQPHYTSKQLNYEPANVMTGGGFHIDHGVIPDDLFDRLFGSVEKKRYTTDKTKRMVNTHTKKTKRTM